MVVPRERYQKLPKSSRIQKYDKSDEKIQMKQGLIRNKLKSNRLNYLVSKDKHFISIKM